MRATYCSCDGASVYCGWVKDEVRSQLDMFGSCTNMSTRLSVGH
jgi:hypothetical protein